MEHGERSVRGHSEDGPTPTVPDRTRAAAPGRAVEIAVSSQHQSINALPFIDVNVIPIDHAERVKNGESGGRSGKRREQ